MIMIVYAGTAKPFVDLSISGSLSITLIYDI